MDDMNKKLTTAKIGYQTASVADLIQSHQDLLEQDDQIQSIISLGRKSMDFFMSIENDSRVLYEVTQVKRRILQFLGLID
jgi:hypothetical protein